jgi:Novel STAND NTPase 3
LKDGGRDGAFMGEWNPTDALRLTGETVVQCKFTSRRDATFTLSAFLEELTKAKNLWWRWRRENYVVLTNYRVTAEFEEATRRRFAEFGCSNFHVFGYEWLVGAIQQSPRLRTLVPRLYGLGDLSQILDERWYSQTRKLLETERENLRKFVPTRSYRQAVEALNEHDFVLLLGEPAVGKTAIAATLTLASGDAWKCRPMKIEHAPELRERWNPSDPKQLFWIDDAFGAMQYDSRRAHEWNSIFPWLGAVLKSGAKVILTSRDTSMRMQGAI